MPFHLALYVVKTIQSFTFCGCGEREVVKFAQVVNVFVGNMTEKSTGAFYLLYSEERNKL